MTQNRVWIIDERCRIIGEATLDENPDGVCVIDNRGERWIGPRKALKREGSQLRLHDGLDGDPAERRLQALITHLTEAIA